MTQLTAKASASLDGTIICPGDKSVSHRSLIFGALAKERAEYADGRVQKNLWIQYQSRLWKKFYVTVYSWQNERPQWHHGILEHFFRAANALGR